jgi:hypothetical protein
MKFQPDDLVDFACSRGRQGPPCHFCGKATAVRCADCGSLICKTHQRKLNTTKTVCKTCFEKPEYVEQTKSLLAQPATAEKTGVQDLVELFCDRNNKHDGRSS